MMQVSAKVSCKSFVWIMLLVLMFYLQLTGCSKKPEEPVGNATLIFTSSLNFASSSAKSKNKITSRAIDSTSITSISITVSDTSGRFSKTDIISNNNNTLSFSVPSFMELIISGKAYKGEALRYHGGSTVNPINPGGSRAVSFLMYSIDAEPILVDVGLANKPTNSQSVGSGLSLSQKYVLFTSSASNLIENDTNEASDLFLRDLDSDKIINVNSSSDGVLANNPDGSLLAEAAISVDGRYVVFASVSSNLVPDDTNGVSDVFLKDTLTDSTIRISVTTDGAQAESASYQVDISNDGKTILFYSEANLLNENSRGLYLYDRLSQALTFVAADVQDPKLSGDGKYFVYVDATSNSLRLFDLVNSKSTTIISITNTEKTNDKPSNKPQNQIEKLFEYEINYDGQSIVLVSAKDALPILKKHVYLYENANVTFSLLSKNGDILLATDNTELRYPGISADGRFAIFRFNKKIVIKDIVTNVLEIIAEGETPFLRTDGQQLGYTDISGHVLLQNNPLYVAEPSPTDLPIEVPAQLSFNLNSESGDNNSINLSWSAIDGSNFYRAYFSTEKGLSPENYISKENGLQIETLNPSVLLPVEYNNFENVYAVVTMINDDGEGLPSNELTLSIPFSVTEIFPLAGAINTPADVKPKLTFNRNINLASIGDDAFALGYGEFIIKGETTFPDSRSIEFTPAQPLVSDRQYKLLLSNTIVDLFGQSSDFASTTFTVIPESVTFATVGIKIIGGSGSVMPLLPQMVALGEQTKFSLQPAIGYSIKNVSGCNGTLNSNIYTTAVITSACSVSVDFAIDTFSLLYSSGANGAISGILSQTIDYGFNGSTVTAEPALGYEFVQWSDNNVINPRTDTNVKSNISVSASFDIAQYMLNYSAGANGSLTGDLSQVVAYGGSGTLVTATPVSADYVFINWSDGKSANSRTDLNVASDISVTANFDKISFVVSLQVGVGGSVSPSTAQNVYLNDTVSFTLTPDFDYRISQAYGRFGCSGTLIGNVFTTTAITTNCLVKVTFQINDAPIITTKYSGLFYENNTFVVKNTSFDAESDPITYRISGGVDQNFFTVGSTSGDLSFIDPPNFEVPRDFNKNNFYEVELVANDGTLDSKVFKFSIRVLDAKEVGILLNDTAVTSCTDTASFSICPQPSYPGQDAEFGRDAMFNNDSNGHAGFDFTKLDATGKVLASDAKTWMCVKDNNTGLIWEVKTTDGGNRDYRNTYPNFLSYYNLLLNELVNNSLCGVKNWRLPTIIEQQSIIDFSATNPAIDAAYFPNTINTDPAYYWSGVHRYINNVVYNSWMTNFASGAVSHANKENKNYIRFVYGN